MSDLFDFTPNAGAKAKEEDDDINITRHSDERRRWLSRPSCCAVAMQRRSIVLVFSMGPCFCFGGVLLACYGLVVCTHHDVLLVRGEGLFSLNLSLAS